MEGANDHLRIALGTMAIALVGLAAACSAPTAPSGARLVADGGPNKGVAPPKDAPKAIPKKASVRHDVSSNDRHFAKALTGHTNRQFVGDLDAIKKRNVLRVLTRNNSTSYFLHRGVEAGFHYELAKMFADELGVRLEMVVPKASRDLIPWLLEGRGDIVLAAIGDDAPRIDRVATTRPYLTSPLVVVTRKGHEPKVDSLQTLQQVTTLVQPSSSTLARLRQVSKEQGLKFDLRAVRETVEAEDLLDFVADGRADAAVVVERIASAELLVRDDLEISATLDVEPIRSVVAVRKEDEKLFAATDSFLRRNVRGTLFNIFYKRFHENKRRTKRFHNEEVRADKDGAISPYDTEFQLAAKTAGVDWRLLAAQAYQESRFNPKAKSEWGAVGLMQMLPSTAREMGVNDPWDPGQSIIGGAAYLGKMVKRFKSDDVQLKDAVRFALAAYNCGMGHVDDARRLAKKRGLNPNRWFDNVAKAMLLLEKPRFYRHARYGYARGSEPFRYVSEIQTRYDNYVALTEKKGPAPDALQAPAGDSAEGAAAPPPPLPTPAGSTTTATVN